jgi:NADP-dependent 3-hydroxy acid dehydrogenase YdfG
VTPGGLADLTGRRVLVVGASAGIGRAAAVRAAAAGADVVLAARRADVLDEAVAEAGRGTAVAADVADAAGRARLVEATAAALGQIDLVLHAVGVADLGRLDAVDETAWHATLHTNVVAFNLLVRALLPHLAPGALVAALSSEMAHDPWLGMGPYAASKAALETSLRAWRAERPAVRFTCVVVGATQPSDFGAGFTPEALGDALPAWVRHGRLREAFMDTGDLAAAVLGALAAVLAVPGVGLEEIILRSPSPIAGEGWSPAPAARLE